MTEEAAIQFLKALQDCNRCFQDVKRSGVVLMESAGVDADVVKKHKRKPSTTKKQKAPPSQSKKKAKISKSKNGAPSIMVCDAEFWLEDDKSTCKSEPTVGAYFKGRKNICLDHQKAFKKWKSQHPELIPKRKKRKTKK